MFWLLQPAVPGLPMMSPYQVELVLIMANAGELPRTFRVDPRCARINDGRLHMDHDRYSPDGVACRCQEVTA